MNIPDVTETDFTKNEYPHNELARLRLENQRLKATHEQDKIEKAQLKASLAAAEKNGLYDPLFEEHGQLSETVLNRRGIGLMFGRELERIKRRGRLTLLLLDLDRFKEINDTHGHASGDKVLFALVLAIKNSVRTTDIIGRSGGDEFVVGLVDADEEEALEVAQRIQRHLLSTTQETLPHLPISQKVSIGISQAKENDQLENLIERADTALYQQKQKTTIWIVVECLFPRSGQRTAFAVKLYWEDTTALAVELHQAKEHRNKVVFDQV